MDSWGPTVDSWTWTFDGGSPHDEATREALCTLGNGYVATCGAAPEAFADGSHYPGTYAAGCYNRLPDVIDGVQVENESMVNLPNWLPLTMRVDDGPWLGSTGCTEADGDDVNRYRVSKQADVLMLFYLLSADEPREILGRCGYPLEPDARRSRSDAATAPSGCRRAAWSSSPTAPRPPTSRNRRGRAVGTLGPPGWGRYALRTAAPEADADRTTTF